MTPFPHRYEVAARAAVHGDVALEGDRLPALDSAPPADFGGPGDKWSPETLFVAAVVDCFILTFRAIAGVSRLPWISLDAHAAGTVDRVERVTQFTALQIQAQLRVPPGTNEEQALRLLAKAEETCLVTNSLKVRPRLEATIAVADAS